MRNHREKREISRHLSRSILLKESGSPLLLRVILLFFTIIILFFIYWSQNVDLNQVVITSGEVLTKDDVIELQHPRGGVIKDVLVEDGQLVNTGDVIMVFDGDNNDLKIKEEISKISTLNRRLKLLQEEMDIKKELLDEQLISKSSYLLLERNYNESLGERTQAYYRLESLRQEGGQLELVSPINGYIHYLKNRGEGTIIRSGETILEIVPKNREFVAELMLDAGDRGKIDLNQKVILKFTSYDFSKFGGIESVVESISVTTFINSFNRAYYKVYVLLPKGYVGERENEMRILPGMTVTGEIGVGTSSLLEYLIVPIKTAKDNSFNES